MVSEHTFGIEFIPRKCKGNSESVIIYVRIVVDSERAEVSTKEKIDHLDWDATRSIVKGKTIQVKGINQHLTEIEHQIRTKYRELKELQSLITAETLKQAYLGIHSSQKGHTLLELIAYFKKIWKEKLRHGSYKNYKTTIAYTEEFLATIYPKRDVYLSQVTNEFLTELEHYIRNHPIKAHDSCQGNGLGKHIQRFKRIMSWATDELRWIKYNEVAKYKCPIKKNKRKKLTFEQLVMLEQKQFSDSRLNYVKDLFLFSCFTGFSYADVMSLAAHHLEWEGDETVWCMIYRLKSDVLSPIPLTSDAAKIINRYRLREQSTPRRTIFVPVSNQQVNRQLKIIQEACEIPIPLTFHIARHTFAKR